jgi:hypothetical protein
VHAVLRTPEASGFNNEDQKKLEWDVPSLCNTAGRYVLGNALEPTIAMHSAPM